MIGAQERLARSVLRHLGQDAFLVQGTTRTPTRINVQRGVEIMGQFSDAVMLRDIALIDARLKPKVGDLIEHPRAGVYVLDGVIENNGFTMRFTLQPTTLPVVAPPPAPADPDPEPAP